MRAVIDEAIVAAVHARLAQALRAPSGEYVPVRVDAHVIGWVDAGRAARLADFDRVFSRGGDGLHLAAHLHDAPSRSAALEHVTRTLAAEGLLSPWRDEAYVIAASFGAEPLCHVERAAARYFGIMTYAAHLNGIVEQDRATRMWIARRSATKAIDPGQLDNLVGGGIRANTSVAETLVREAWEEAGIDENTARRAISVGIVRICRAQPEGLQREIIFVHDLLLAPDYTPRCVDGEAVEHRLVSLAEAARVIAQSSGPDVMTGDACLVVLDCLIRRGLLSPDSPHYVALAQLRWPENGAGSNFPLARISDVAP